MKKAFWQDEIPADTRRERRKQEIREKIVQAAIELFESKGCDATTLEEICERAEVSRPTFYSYYASKQELIFALGEKLWLNVARELTAHSMARSDSAAAYVEAFFKLTRQEIAKYSRLERELIRQSMNSDPSENSHMNILKALTQLFVSVYGEGRKQGGIGNRYPIDFLAEMTMGCISSVMMNWAVDETYPVDKRLKQLADLTVQMISLEK